MAIAKFRIPMINGRTSQSGADAVNLSALSFSRTKLRHLGRCRGKKRQFAELAKREERTSGLHADKKRHVERSFLSRWQASMSRYCTYKSKPKDRQMSEENTLTNSKNKPSGMENALVSSETLTADRIALGSEEKQLRSTPIYFFWGTARKTSHLLS
jgi:hypothetical protein